MSAAVRTTHKPQGHGAMAGAAVRDSTVPQSNPGQIWLRELRETLPEAGPAPQGVHHRGTCGADTSGSRHNARRNAVQSIWVKLVN